MVSIAKNAICENGNFLPSPYANIAGIAKKTLAVSRAVNALPKASEHHIIRWTMFLPLKFSK